LAGCSAPPPGSDISDPYEAQNRQVHEFNKSVDRALFGDGTGNGILPEIPQPVARGLGNLSANLGAPRNVVNGVLQGRVDTVATNTFRFLINSTLGIGGLFDPAAAIGIDRDDTDFGETLAVWGMPEGAYVELPLLGPSTSRDALGKLVDIAIDPVTALADSDRERLFVGLARVGGAIANRQRFSDTYESILYESADSYAQARLLYLQNRRFELGQEAGTTDDYEDIYAE
jgi:phospholipid-binding lipoprotein MlaA